MTKVTCMIKIIDTKLLFFVFIPQKMLCFTHIFHTRVSLACIMCVLVGYVCSVFSVCHA